VRVATCNGLDTGGEGQCPFKSVPAFVPASTLQGAEETNGGKVGTLVMGIVYVRNGQVLTAACRWGL